CTAGGILLRPEARAHAGLPSTDEVGCRRANRYTSNGEGPAMKNARVKIYLIASGKLQPVIVEIVTDQGVSGSGGAAIRDGLGGTATAGMVKDLSERTLIGRDPFRIEEIWSEMYDHSFWAKGGGPIVFAAISGIEQALWDIKGKALGIPVYDFLGGRMRDR